MSRKTSRKPNRKASRKTSRETSRKSRETNSTLAQHVSIDVSSGDKMYVDLFLGQTRLTLLSDQMIELHTDIINPKNFANNRPWHTVVLNRLGGYAMEIGVNAGEAFAELRTPYSTTRVALTEKEAENAAKKLRKEFMDTMYVNHTTSHGKLMIPGRVPVYQSRKTIIQRK